MQKNWTNDEILLLREYYGKLPKLELIKIFNRSWSSIQNKAFLLNINRYFNNIEKLVDGTLESYYWLGFIMADGHFSKNKVLQINLGIKDIEHLRKLNSYLERTVELSQPRLAVPINKIWDKLIDLFNITTNKTHNPCLLSSMTGDILFAFTIGFIDGDGSIDKGGGIRVKCHKNWLNNIDIMLESIAGTYFYNCYINNEGLALGTLGSIECTKKIKRKAEELNLPLLKRKWDRISENKLSKREVTNKNKNICYTLFKENKSIKNIIMITGLSQSQVYKQYSEYRESIKEKDAKREMESTK